jgi:gamma-butyrobetaine dioxygenase
MGDTPEDPVTTLLAPLRSRGGDAYLGEAVTQSAHALQAADLAAASGASDELMVAALLHDLGWLIGGSDEDHAGRGADLIARWLPPAVSEPVRLHVEAKRWLCAVDAGYHDRLSDASRRTLVRQGGPMSAEEVAAWEARPWTADAVSLRRWDDEAKVAGRPAAGTERWEPIVRALIER